VLRFSFSVVSVCFMLHSHDSRSAIVVGLNVSQDRCMNDNYLIVSVKYVIKNAKRRELFIKRHGNLKKLT
jgi:hypothetical protein